tara:strand:- start:60684 stop:62954 length:2271 start_codon:yes stop_codon:yes gene_type:complete
MKKNYLYQIHWCLIFTFSLFLETNAQSIGSIAFTAFNADGDDDFAIVTLADITANSTIYFTDNESDGMGGITSGEGTLTWLTGSNIIKAGTIIVFTDVDNGTNPNFGVSIGSLSETGGFNLSPSSKDGIIAFIGVDDKTPTSFITAIQIGNDSSTLGPFDGDSITLTGTGLVIGTSIVVIDSSASPDGATYVGSRSNQASYLNYYALLNDDIINWTNIVNGDGETLLPFSTEAFTINTTTWTGNISNAWDLAGNWDNGIPSSSSFVTIPDATKSPIISNNVEVGNLVINTGETLTIEGSKSLNVSGQLLVSGSLNLNSESSIIVFGSSSGDITYTRTLSTANWYLISSPVIGQDEDDFVSTSGLANGSGSNLGLGSYNTSSETWSYYQGMASASTLNNGQGYSIKLASSGDISFTGTLLTYDLTPIVMTTTGNGFNLVGNPYPSYINSASILTSNTDALLTETFWIWDQSANTGTGAYITKVTADAFQIAPGQGFFVQSDADGGNLSIKKNHQSHQGVDTFLRNSNPRPEVHLNLTDGTNEVFAKVYYIDGATTGFDNGYDGPMFGGVTNSFAIYTHAATNEFGRNLAIQSLPNNNYENLVIPIGINASLGTEIIITADVIDFPTGINVLLEDRENNSFTRLNQANAKYTTTLSSELDGIGRFFLHTSSNVLDTNEFTYLDHLSIYSTNQNNLRITGALEGNVQLELYSVLGKEVLRTSFIANEVNDVTIPNLKAGIYVIQIKNQKGILNRKVIIE